MTDLLVDANSLYARGWYAARQDPVAALQHVLNLAIMLFNTNRMNEPINRALFAWDGGQKRDKGRAERPAAYELNKEPVQKWLEYIFGTPNVRIEGIEADDVLATAALHSKADHVIIATGDKDLHQLSSSRVSIFDISAKGMVSRREILAKWGVKKPLQVSIALAIQGDSADKIAGISGWGPKKVKMLFEAVTDQMDFQEALEVIQNQIPADKHDEFIESLDLTLLNPDIPGVPQPVAVSFAEPRDLHSLPVEVRDHYRHVHTMYQRPSDAALDAYLREQ